MRVNIRSNLYKLVSIILFGSGVINVLSASGHSVFSRQKLLLELFPLEFLHLSNFLTLVLGIAFCLTALNLYRRKRKAYLYALVFSFFSIVFHLTKGLDYEEAIFSLFILTVLFLTRKEYQVKSETFNYRHFLINILISFSLVLLYGIVGFWLLDKRELGIKFTPQQSLVQTLKQITFAVGTELTPKTRYAWFFLNSLRWASILIIGFSFSSFFAPILFRFIKSAENTKKARALLEKYGNSSLDYFKIWPDKSYFFSQEGQAFISYGVSSNVAVSLGDPIGEKSSLNSIIKEFYNYGTQNGWRCGFYQVLPNLLNVYHQLGFKSFKVGDNATVDLNKFAISGKEGKKFRRVINNLEKDGFITEEINIPVDEATVNKLKQVSDSWLKIKGRRERTFSLGYFENGYISSTPAFVAKDAKGEIVAFANIVPSYVKGEATIDLMRHRKDAPNGTMDFLFIKLFLHLKEQGFTRFSLGLAPMSGFSIGEKSTRAEKAIYRFAQNANFLFSFKGLKAYKAKYASFWEPRYLIYKNVLDLPLIAKALNELSKYPK